MRFLTGSLLILSAIALASGCSKSNKGNSSTSNVEGWVGAQGFNSAQVVINQVAESGQVSRDGNDILLGLRESTNELSRFNATVQNDETLLFVARGQIANVDKDKKNLATQRQCQVASGCTVLSTEYKFAEFYPATTGFEWRGVAYTVSNGSRNNVNAITTLAAAFAYKYDVKYGYDNHPEHKGDSANGIAPDPLNNTANDVFANENFTPYDVVLANSQTSKLLGILDVIGNLPANLTKLNSLGGNTVEIQNQIRYGALLAGLQQLELVYWANHSAVGEKDFISVLAEQFANDQGQFYNHTPTDDKVLTLQNLYQAAHDNLASVAASVANASVKAASNEVVAKFAEQITAIKATAANSKTSAVADDLSQLLTASEVKAFNQGLWKTKSFVNDLIKYHQTFWQPNYKSELDGYISMLRKIGVEHRKNLDDLVNQFARTQSYYVNCTILVPASDECTKAYDPKTREGLLDIHNLEKTYDVATKTLTFKDSVTVSQKVADVNTLDKEKNPTSSHAIDIYITGKLEKNGLVLTLAHDLDSAKEKIDIPSSMRIFYNKKVSEVPSVISTGADKLEIQGYELIWGEFQLYDKSKLGQSFDPLKPELGAETELSGAFRIFYRGVRDPQNTNTPNDSELRFNIENWVLSSTISDKVDDTTGTDRETTRLVTSAKSTNPETFYPAEKLANFKGFFTPNDAHKVGGEIAGLMEYRLSTESVPFGSNKIEVQTIDFINSRNDDVRYRFYPNEREVDKNDSDRDGNKTEIVDFHFIEECKLDETSGNVTSCNPKSKIYAKLNVQKTINDLWELGNFQRLPVKGRGTYFVDFPTEKNEQGCYELKALSNDQGAMKGTLIEQQVLGLNSVRLFTEVKIENAKLVDLPKTLADITVVAPTKDKYRITAAVSHNYSGNTADASGVVLGTGGSASSLLVSYDTTNEFKNAGNLTVAKGGVSVSLADGSKVTENQDLTAFLTQTYDPSSVHYKITEDAEGRPDRCVLSVGKNYVKDPESANFKQAFNLNYRDVVYGTIRPEGSNKKGEDPIWTIRFIDGTWLIPSDGKKGE